MDNKEIVKLMTACRKHRVESIQVGDIHIKFAVESEAQDTVDLPQNSRDIYYGDTRPRNRSEDAFSMGTAAEREVLEELRKSQLLLDDPVAFEQMMIDTEIERDRDIDA